MALKHMGISTLFKRKIERTTVRDCFHFSGWHTSKSFVTIDEDINAEEIW
jgi:hypothetical protein